MSYSFSPSRYFKLVLGVKITCLLMYLRCNLSQSRLIKGKRSEHGHIEVTAWSIFSTPIPRVRSEQGLLLDMQTMARVV